MSEHSLLSFPCDIPIKVLGRNGGLFREAALTIVRTHYKSLEPQNVSEKPSRGGTYLSLTFTVTAESRAQIDAVYLELTASDQILMVL
jgi:putative lipoic acid-binding regulatory protein